MRWVDTLVEDICPKFGGVPTFVEDPDHLLDIPAVREALRSREMVLGDWDGLPTSLAPLKALKDHDRPLLVVGDGAQQRRHIVIACLQDFLWLSISIGQLFPKFAPDVVRAIPTERWDSLLALHEGARLPRTPQETALLIGRALYGIDPEFLRHGEGWTRLVTRIAVADEPLPAPIARALVETAPPPWKEMANWEALTETANVRAALESVLAAHPQLYERAQRAEQLLLNELHTPYAVPRIAQSPPDLLAAWEQCGQYPADVLQFGLIYAQAQDTSPLPGPIRRDINHRFVAWLKTNYGMLQSAPNPAVLRLPTLLDTLDSEFAQERFVLFVVDSLGLSAWERVRKRWIAEGIIATAQTRAAFAVLPTITTLSRRALFEGKLPSQFASPAEAHSQRLERTLWAKRYGAEGVCLHEAEARGFADSLAQGRFRICFVDVSWDKRGHSIDPRTDSVPDAANVWAGRTSLRGMIGAALDAGYRVLLTADHGQTECVGQGRIQVGSLSDERSKRVMLFHDKSACNNMQKDWTDNFRPTGLPMDMFPLFAADFHSFDLKDAATVSHGGLSLDEVLVPVAELRR